MAGISAVATRRSLSAGTLLVFGGGLLLYQMTSLVLGPAGSRQLHLSLTIPAVDLEESSESWSSSINLVGTLAGPGSAVSMSVASTGSRRASGVPAAPRPAPAPVPVPVGSQPPATHPSSHPVAPIVGQPDVQADARNLDDAD